MGTYHIGDPHSFDDPRAQYYPAKPAKTAKPAKPLKPLVNVYNRTLLEANVPAELRVRAQWIYWVGKKIPKCPMTNAAAACNDLASWGTFAQACDACEKAGGNGIGYVFTATDPYAGVDLDYCVDSNGQLTQEAQTIVNSINSYTEWSPSNLGIHALVRLTDKTWVRGINEGDIGRECYATGRYFCVTGCKLPASPVTIELRDAEFKAFHDDLWARRGGRASKPGAKIERDAQNQIVWDKDKTIDALTFLSPDCGYSSWLAVGMALHSTGDDSAIDLWDSWSQRSTEYDLAEIEYKWSTFHHDRNGGVGLGTLFALAMENGWAPEPPQMDHQFATPVPAWDECLTTTLPWNAMAVPIHTTEGTAATTADGTGATTTVSQVMGEEEPEAPVYLPPTMDEVLEAIKESPLHHYMYHAQFRGENIPLSFLLLDSVMAALITMTNAERKIYLEGDTRFPQLCNAYGMKLGGSGSGKGVTGRILDEFLKAISIHDQAIEFINGQSAASICNHAGGKNAKPLARFGYDRRSEVSQLMSVSDPSAKSVMNFYLEQWDRQRFTYGIAGGGNDRRIIIDPCALSLVIEGQPDVIESCASGGTNLGSGLTARFITSVAPPECKGRLITVGGSVDIEAIVYAYSSLFRNPSRIIRPATTPLTRADAYLPYMTQAETESWRRLKNDYLPKIAAALVGLDVHNGDWQITQEALARAGVVVDYFFSGSQQLTGLIHDDRYEARRRRIERYIAEHPYGVSDRTLFRSFHFSKPEFDRDIRPTLIARGHVTQRVDSRQNVKWYPMGVASQQCDTLQADTLVTGIKGVRESVPPPHTLTPTHIKKTTLCVVDTQSHNSLELNETGVGKVGVALSGTLDYGLYGDGGDPQTVTPQEVDAPWNPNR